MLFRRLRLTTAIGMAAFLGVSEVSAQDHHQFGSSRPDMQVGAPVMTPVYPQTSSSDSSATCIIVAMVLMFLFLLPFAWANRGLKSRRGYGGGEFGGYYDHDSHVSGDHDSGGNGDGGA